MLEMSLIDNSSPIEATEGVTAAPMGLSVATPRRGPV